MGEKLQFNDTEVEQRFNEVISAEFGVTTALNGLINEVDAIDEVEVTKHSSKAASRAKAFASISGSGCTDD